VKIVFNQADRAPKFDFDKSTLVDQDRDVARSSRQMRDDRAAQGARSCSRAHHPRGEVEYNSFSERIALKPSRLPYGARRLEGEVVATTRGKLDATGTDTPAGRQDRRSTLTHVRSLKSWRTVSALVLRRARIIEG